MSISAGAAAAIAAGSAAISTGGSAIANGVRNRKSYKYTQRLQDDAQAFQSEEALKAWQRELDMWNMTNEYNSPLNQRKRLEAAGKNPFVDGSIAPTEAQMGDAPQASGGTVGQFQAGAPDFSAFGNILPQMLTAAQINKTNADTAKVEAETDTLVPALVAANEAAAQYSLSAGANQKALAALSEFDLIFKQATFETDVQTAAANLDKAYKSLAILDEELNDKKFKNAVLNPLEARYKDEMIQYTAAQTAVLEIQKQYQAQLNESQLQYLNSAASLMAQNRLTEIERTREAAASANVAEKRDEKFYADRTHKLVLGYAGELNKLISTASDLIPFKGLGKKIFGDGEALNLPHKSKNLAPYYDSYDDIPNFSD